MINITNAELFLKKAEIKRSIFEQAPDDSNSILSDLVKRDIK